MKLRQKKMARSAMRLWWIGNPAKGGPRFKYPLLCTKVHTIVRWEQQYKSIY